MTPTSNNYEELTRLVSSLLERPLSEPERVRLEALLQADSTARRLYQQMIDQEVELSCLLVPAGTESERREKIVPLHPSLATEPGKAASQRWRRWRLAAAAAVVLLIGTALALVVSRNHSKSSDPREVVTPAPVVREVWSEDFEQGSLRGWAATLVFSNLPPGSSYGVAAIPRDYPGAGTVHTIQLPEEWSQGLFALTKGSMLNVTCRLASRTHVNVLMHTIPADAAAAGYEMYQLRTAPFGGRFGEWRTVSIPFSDFVRKIVVQQGGAREFAGGPPEAGERVTTLSFSSPEPIDFVIDRVWVTPAAPPREEARPNRTLQP